MERRGRGQSDLAVCGDGCGDVRRSGTGGKRLDDAGSFVEDLDEDDSLNAERPSAIAPFLSRTLECIAPAPSCCRYNNVLMEILMQLWRPESKLDGINSGSW